MSTYYIFVTGFGPFSGIKDNPSSQLVGRLTEEYRKQYNIISADVVETSIQGVEEYFKMVEGKFAEVLEDDKKNIIFLHLGVAASRDCFAIESRAKNEATFGCCDERKNQPNKETIENSKELSHYEYSKVKVSELCQTFNMTEEGEGGGKKVGKTSNDVGLFVCNYMYYTSLKFTRNMENCKSLFVHVPHQGQWPVPYQFKLLKNLLSMVTNY